MPADPRRQAEWMKRRKRPPETKWVSFSRVEKYPEKNSGLTPLMEITTGDCPCSVCGHTYMYECEDAMCDCCSSACT